MESVGAHQTQRPSPTCCSSLLETKTLPRRTNSTIGILCLLVALPHTPSLAQDHGWQGPWCLIRTPLRLWTPHPAYPQISGSHGEALTFPLHRTHGDTPSPSSAPARLDYQRSHSATSRPSGQSAPLSLLCPHQGPSKVLQPAWHLCRGPNRIGLTLFLMEIRRMMIMVTAQ